MSHRHRHHHHCPVCHRPLHGLTADAVFDILTRRLSSGRIALRALPLRRLAKRIGTCDCHIRFFNKPRVARSLVAELVKDQRTRARLLCEAA